MLVWSTNRVYWEHYTDQATGKQKTTGIRCVCGLCGPVDNAMPLVRFDRVRLDEQPEQGYPRVGVCSGCIIKAQHTIDQHTAEAGIVRIGSPYGCSCCRKHVSPVVWFDVSFRQEQYVCAHCLLEVQSRMLIEQEDLKALQKHLY